MSILFVWYMYTFSPDEVSENQNNEVVSSEISSSKSNENLFVMKKELQRNVRKQKIFHILKDSSKLFLTNKFLKKEVIYLSLLMALYVNFLG